MSHKLIADAGSTKVEWCLLSNEGVVLNRFSTQGINALLASPDDAMQLFRDVAARLDINVPIAELHYYGAGCATPQTCNKIADALSAAINARHICVTTDLLGSARALFGDSKGVACILGTGSNSCLYDGEKIVENVPSLGFILGDEGSGAALGKRLVADAFKGLLPESVSSRFLAHYDLSLADILNKVYKEASPNRFLASLVPFLKENLWNPYVYSLILTEFMQFTKRNLSMYEGVHSLKIGFTGSIAAHFENILREAVASQGLSVNQIMQNPLDGLISYHSTHNF